MLSSEDILSQPPPAADQHLAYGPDPNQFLETRLPSGKGPHPALIFIHGGYWRAKYDLAHAGHLCHALGEQGIATINLEYRRVGNPGGAWPGTFDDIRSACRFVQQSAPKLAFDAKRITVMGHSAGGQLALCLAAHEPSLRSVISLAGVVNLKQAYQLHLSHDAVVEFLGGTPSEVADHYREADPTELRIGHARQWLLHGLDDDSVPPAFSREYALLKKKSREHIELVEIARCGHFELIDPRTEIFRKHVVGAVVSALHA